MRSPSATPTTLQRTTPEETRYAWRAIHKGVKDSEWMMGGVADLAFGVALSPGGPWEPGDAARALADYLVECNAGTLVNALPISAATSQFSVAVRQLLAEAFQVDFIVSSHDPKRAHFSEKGKTPEVLLICRARISSPEVPSATRVINLAGNPSTPEEAQATAANITDCIDSSPPSIQPFGSIQKIGSAELYEGDWGAVHFLSPFLRKQFRKLRHGDKFCMTHLGAIADIGPTGRSVRDAFSKSQLAPEVQEYKALWGQDNDRTQMMRATAVSSVWAHPERLSKAGRYWDHRSRLLLPLQPYLPKVRSMAVRLDEPTLGSMWTNCGIKPICREPEQFEKALCVYFNSTIGILAMLGSFTRSESLLRQRPTVQELKKLTVPDFTQEDGILKVLAASFDELGERVLLPLSQSETCPVRRAIDHAVCEALGISSELVQSIREHVVAEPSVTTEGSKGEKSPQVEASQTSFQPRLI